MRPRRISWLSAFALAATGWILPGCLIAAGAGEKKSTAAAALPREVEGIVLPFQEVIIGATAQKRIEEIRVDEGDKVEKGDLIAILDSKVEELEMQRFFKILEKREFENKAAESLAKEKFISKDEALERSLELEIAKIQHLTAQAKFEMLQLRSPISGVVADRLKDAGESVEDSEPMFRLVDVSRVFVQFYLGSEDVFLLKKGRELEVSFSRLPEGKRNFRGRVSFVSPVIDGSSRLLRVKLLLDNPDGQIIAGMRGNVRLPGMEKTLLDETVRAERILIGREVAQWGQLC